MLVAEKKTSGRVTNPTLGATPSFAWKQIAEPVEPFLQAVASRLAEQVESFDPAIAAYAQYALSSQGKQLRPVLVGLSGGALGRLGEAHVTAAVIIEMIHLATLVHDDVLDEAEIRRGRPTMAANWGNDLSVLLGDCLFAQALTLAASYPTPDVCRAVAAATNTVCAGEILQTRFRRNFQLTQAHYYKVLAMKTGELFALSCELAAYLSQATPAQCQTLRQYGLALGTAYQVFDDCVDLFGTEARAGKSLGTDLAKGKLTLPVLLLLERVAEEEKERLRAMISEWTPDRLEQLRQLLLQHQTLPDSRQAIQRFLEDARQSLAALPAGENRDGLLGLTHLLARETGALGGGS